jgi:hypothetical protein
MGVAPGAYRRGAHNGVVEAHRRKHGANHFLGSE